MTGIAFWLRKFLGLKKPEDYEWEEKTAPLFNREGVEVMAIGTKEDLIKDDGIEDL